MEFRPILPFRPYFFTISEFRLFNSLNSDALFRMDFVRRWFDERRGPIQFRYSVAIPTTLPCNK